MRTPEYNSKPTFGSELQDYSDAKADANFGMVLPVTRSTGPVRFTDGTLPYKVLGPDNRPVDVKAMIVIGSQRDARKVIGGGRKEDRCLERFTSGASAAVAILERDGRKAALLLNSEEIQSGSLQLTAERQAHTLGDGVNTVEIPNPVVGAFSNVAGKIHITETSTGVALQMVADNSMITSGVVVAARP